MDVVEQALKLSGFEQLNPVQKLALKAGLLEDKNLVVFAPTSSGKTLIAEIAALNTILNKKRKVVYLTPLVALASEKYETFKKKYANLGIKVALSVGNYDSADPFLASYHWIVCTNEKFDSLIRHHAKWIEDVGLIVADELHLLGDASRGPTLEIILTLAKNYLPFAQILALSATINNAEELAEWLNASVVYSDWRPVKIYYGVAYPYVIEFLEKESVKLEEQDLALSAAKYVLSKRKQALFFVSTRRRAESLAEKLAEVVDSFLLKNEKAMLAKIAEQVENALEIPTKQCKREGKCIKRGVAFHHAGLVFKQRKLIEDNFRKGLIKIIVATPTLALGVNTPSFFVGIKDVKRYYPKLGTVYLQNLEVQQMLGRSGRIDYDEYGEGILFAKNESEAEELKQRYFFAELEDIKSKLALEPVLRMHILSLVATQIISSVESLLDFFEKTFFAHQFANTYYLREKIVEILEFLVESGFIQEKNGKLVATRIGKRVSELYIDPLTAIKLIDYIKAKKFNLLSTLLLVASCLEMKPLPNVRLKEYADIEEFLEKNKAEIFLAVPAEWELEYEEFLQATKLALILNDWINEKSEEEILEKYDITPGELYSRLQIAEWLCYALQEISLLLKRKEIAKHARKLRLRIKYGIKEELFSLIKLQGIGRVRARKLYNANIKSLAQLKKVPLATLQKIIGVKTAIKVKKQLEGKKKKFRKQFLNEE